MRMLVACALIAGATLLVTVPLRSQDSAPGRQRLYDSPAPGQLLGPTDRPPIAPAPPAGEALAKIATDGWELDPATGAYYKRGELLAKFSDGSGSIQRSRAFREANVRPLTPSLPDDWQLVSIDDGRTTRGALAELQAQDGVESASLNYLAKPTQVRPNDEFFNYQWNFDAINMSTAWAINPGATSNVTVAVIDTGLTTVSDTFVYTSPFVGQVAIRFATNPDLATSSRIVQAYDFVYRDAVPLDLHGHGTHVAGTIAQTTGNNIGLAGIAYNVKLMPLKVLAGFDDWDLLLAGRIGGDASMIAEAITYAANNGANVINLSLGGTGSMPVVRDAIRNAVAKGVFVAMAAGNDAAEGNPTFYPAAYAQEIDGAMAVGAVDRNLHKAPYSEFGPYVEICAPGGTTNSETDFANGVTQVTYADGDSLAPTSGPFKLFVLQRGLLPRFDRYFPTPYQGTSMASPHVAGVAALLYSQGIHNPAAIEAAIKQFARHLDVGPNDCGSGLIDARAALRGLGIGR